MQFQPQHTSINPESVNDSINQSRFQTRHCTMGHAFSLFWNHYVDFPNYSTRAEFWWVKLWELIIYGGICSLVSLIYGKELIAGLSQHNGADLVGIFLSFGVLGLCLFVFYLATVIPLYALRTRRFNDVGIPTMASICIVVSRPILYSLVKVNSIFFYLWLFMILVSFIIEILPTGTFKANSPSIVTPYGNFYPSPSMNPYNRPPMINYNPYQSSNHTLPNQNRYRYYQTNTNIVHQNQKQNWHS